MRHSRLTAAKRKEGFLALNIPEFYKHEEQYAIFVYRTFVRPDLRTFNINFRIATNDAS